ncbi:hypothetical protein COTS27_00039 [Spirochaetota bacterium]|nr:hypothetical protein COTS27_00039 [Spirochaetota bacterium]
MIQAKRTMKATKTMRGSTTSKRLKSSSPRKMAKNKKSLSAKTPSAPKTKTRKILKSCVVITGASSGIGLEFADYYVSTQAEHNCTVVLVSSNRKKLEKTKTLFLNKYPQSSIVIQVLDLSKNSAAQSLIAMCVQKKMHPRVLINNAGIGHIGKFNAMSREELRRLMMLNMNTLTELTYLFLGQMKRREDEGLVINIASTAAFQPMPYFALYAATKAFVLSLTDALAEEYRDENVRFLTVCPGPVRTNFFERAMETSGTTTPTARLIDFFRANKARSPGDVVQSTMRAVKKGTVGMHVDGKFNRILVSLTAWVPYRLRPKLTVKFFKKLMP